MAIGWGGPPEPPATPLLREAAAQLAAYFAGDLRTFDLPLSPSGTAFQLRVWALLREIPYGATRSYAALAAELGDRALVRAVGLANARNPLPIVIPCHRVIGADGALRGYAGGLAAKQALLALEAGAPGGIGSDGAPALPLSLARRPVN